MKYICTTLWALLAVLMFSGCQMIEDTRNCPNIENVTLTLVLKDKDGNEVYTNKIDNTDLMIYNAAGTLIHRQMVLTANLNSSREIKLSLPAGEYSLVAWSNLGGKVEVCTDNDLKSVTTGYVALQSAENGVPAYYAPCPTLPLTRGFNPDNALFQISVPNSGNVVKEVEFVHAYKMIDVYVKNYSVNGKLPIVEVDGNRDGFDFYMNYLTSNTITFRQTTANKITVDGAMANAYFYSARFKDNNNINIHIINPETLERVYSKNLNEVIAAYSNFDLDKTVVIPVVFEFFDGRFEVKMPSWITEGTTPGLD